MVRPIYIKLVHEVEFVVSWWEDHSSTNMRHLSPRIPFMWIREIFWWSVITSLPTILLKFRLCREIACCGCLIHQFWENSKYDEETWLELRRESILEMSEKKNPHICASFPHLVIFGFPPSHHSSFATAFIYQQECLICLCLLLSPTRWLQQ